MDSGVTQGMFGYFLTWMQESKGEKIMIATANSISNLPAEFLRSGRWDCVFFVDVPNRKERKEIIKIMNKIYGSNITDEYIDDLEGFTGAEIRQIAIDSQFEGIEKAIRNTPKVIELKSKDIDKMREVASMVRTANAPELKGIKSIGRKISNTPTLDDKFKKKILKTIKKEE